MACAADRPPNDPEPVRAECLIRPMKTRRPYLFRAKYLKRLPDVNLDVLRRFVDRSVRVPRRRQGQPQLRLTAAAAIAERAAHSRQPRATRTASKRGTQPDADRCAVLIALRRRSVAEFGMCVSRGRRRQDDGCGPDGGARRARRPLEVRSRTAARTSPNWSPVNQSGEVGGPTSAATQSSMRSMSLPIHLTLSARGSSTGR